MIIVSTCSPNPRVREPFQCPLADTSTLECPFADLVDVDLLCFPSSAMAEGTLQAPMDYHLLHVYQPAIHTLSSLLRRSSPHRWASGLKPGDSGPDGPTPPAPGAHGPCTHLAGRPKDPDQASQAPLDTFPPPVPGPHGPGTTAQVGLKGLGLGNLDCPGVLSPGLIDLVEFLPSYGLGKGFILVGAIVNRIALLTFLLARLLVYKSVAAFCWIILCPVLNWFIHF